jgi:hypothetical protein
LEVLQAADFKCQRCGADDVQLHAHHRQYRRSAAPWEYEPHELECLCEDCHGSEHGYAAPVGSESARRNAWERLASFHLEACAWAADQANDVSPEQVESIARRICVESGCDYEALMSIYQGN